MKSDKLNKFNFLLGNWNLEYRIPKSQMSDSGSDRGFGTFKKILDNQYILFEYSTESGGEAKGIFAWDAKIDAYRYWWFENSGNFSTATCQFTSDSILAMNWHDTLLTQTFVREADDRVILRMQHPIDQLRYELILEVILQREHERH